MLQGLTYMAEYQNKVRATPGKKSILPSPSSFLMKDYFFVQVSGSKAPMKTSDQKAEWKSLMVVLKSDGLFFYEAHKQEEDFAVSEVVVSKISFKSKSTSSTNVVVSVEDDIIIENNLFALSLYTNSPLAPTHTTPASAPNTPLVTNRSKSGNVPHITDSEFSLKKLIEKAKQKDKTSESSENSLQVPASSSPPLSLEEHTATCTKFNCSLCRTAQTSSASVPIKGSSDSLFEHSSSSVENGHDLFEGEASNGSSKPSGSVTQWKLASRNRALIKKWKSALIVLLHQEEGERDEGLDSSAMGSRRQKKEEEVVPEKVQPELWNHLFAEESCWRPLSPTTTEDGPMFYQKKAGKLNIYKGTILLNCDPKLLLNYLMNIHKRTEFDAHAFRMEETSREALCTPLTSKEEIILPYIAEKQPTPSYIHLNLTSQLPLSITLMKLSTSTLSCFVFYSTFSLSSLIFNFLALFTTTVKELSPFQSICLLLMDLFFCFLVTYAVVYRSFDLADRFSYLQYFSQKITNDSYLVGCLNYQPSKTPGDQIFTKLLHSTSFTIHSSPAPRSKKQDSPPTKTFLSYVCSEDYQGWIPQVVADELRKQRCKQTLFMLKKVFQHSPSLYTSPITSIVQVFESEADEATPSAELLISAVPTPRVETAAATVVTAADSASTVSSPSVAAPASPLAISGIFNPPLPPRLPPHYVQKLTVGLKEALTIIAEGAKEGWVARDEQEGVQMYRKPNPNFTCIKGIGMIPFTPDHILKALLRSDIKHEYDKMFAEGRVVKQWDENTRLVYQSYKSVWPVASRDFCTLSRTERKADGSILIFAFSVEDDECPPVDKRVRAEARGGFLLEPSGDSATRVTFFSYFNLKGNLPSSVVEFASVNQPLQVAFLRTYLLKQAK